MCHVGPLILGLCARNMSLCISCVEQKINLFYILVFISLIGYISDFSVFVFLYYKTPIKYIMMALQHVHTQSNPHIKMPILNQ